MGRCSFEYNGLGGIGWVRFRGVKFWVGLLGWFRKGRVKLLTRARKYRTYIGKKHPGIYYCIFKMIIKFCIKFYHKIPFCLVQSLQCTDFSKDVNIYQGLKNKKSKDLLEI